MLDFSTTNHALYPETSGSQLHGGLRRSSVDRRRRGEGEEGKRGRGEEGKRGMDAGGCPTVRDP
jgi:hypothetical protein